jgi:hypothetical protein
MSNTNNIDTSRDPEETFILPILPYGLSSGNAYTDTCMLFIATFILVWIIYMFKGPIDEACNSTILMIALIVYFVFNVGKYPMLYYSYELEEVKAS